MKNNHSGSFRKWCIFMMPAVFLLMSSCGGRPSNVLDEDEMVSLMVDMELAEAYTNSKPGARTTKDKLELGRRVLASHGVEPETLDTTLAWYGRNLDEYSKLFEKIDKEILKRRKKYVDNLYDDSSLSDNLWPYSQHLLLSPLSGYESLIISLDEPPVTAGERLKLTFSLPNPAGMKGFLGVDYTDGSSETANAIFNSKAKIELEFQTDTAKKVSRIFGVLSLKDKKDLPLYIDSLLISTVPFDSLEYHQKKRSQKKYGIMVPRPKPVLPKDPVAADSIRPDSISPTPEKKDIPEHHSPKKIDKDKLQHSSK